MRHDPAISSSNVAMAFTLMLSIALLALPLAHGALGRSGEAASPSLIASNLAAPDQPGHAILTTATPLLPAGTVLATIPVGQGPTAIAEDPLAQRVFVAESSGQVAVIDERTRAVAAQIPINGIPTALAVDAALQKLFVVTQKGGELLVITTTSNRIVARVPILSVPAGVVVDPLSHTVYVADEQTDRYANEKATIQTIDARADHLTRSLALYPVGFTIGDTFISDLAINPVARRLYAVYTPSVDASPEVLMLDSRTLHALAQITFPGDDGDIRLATDPTTNLVFAASGTITILAGTNTVAWQRPGARILVGAGPQGMGIDPSTSIVYVANAGSITGYPAPNTGPPIPGSNTVSVFDEGAQRTITTTPVGNTPWDIAVDPRTHLVFVTNLGSASVSVIEGVSAPRSGRSPSAH